MSILVTTSRLGVYKNINLSTGSRKKFRANNRNPLHLYVTVHIADPSTFGRNYTIYNEPCSPYSSLLSGAHVKMDIRGYVGRTMKSNGTRVREGIRFLIGRVDETKVCGCVNAFERMMLHGSV